MLLNLFIKDFGIIEKTEANFSSGLNVLSGETGSGKSIIIDAIQVVAGGRASSEYLRAGSERAIVQITIDPSGHSRITGLLDEKGIADDGGMLVMSREINKNTRSTCRINGQIVTLNMYREIGRQIVDIQGQHDQQLLFDPEVHLSLLDAFGGEEISRAGSVVSRLYSEWLQKKKALSAMRDSHREWARRQDTIRYQIQEIDSVSPRPGEDQELYGEKQKLSGAEKISRLVGECHRDLQGGGVSGGSALESAGRALKNLDKAAEIDGGLCTVRDQLAGSLYQMEESCRELAAYIDGLEFYPARLEYVEERLDLINRVKRKYGDTIEDVLKYRQDIEKELEEMAGSSLRMEALEQELMSLSTILEENASVLTEKRKVAAEELERQIAGALLELGMGKVKFAINFTPQENISERGKEKAEFFISTNTGEPLRPLAKIASGGETSRILLAIKSILAETENIPTLIFDEIDAGIGGVTMNAVALKLLRLAGKRQVICVTHSSAVASMADRHLSIRKSQSGGRTRAGVIRLDEDQRVEELARMLGGEQGGSAAYNHAKHLLQEARLIKSS